MTYPRLVALTCDRCGRVALHQQNGDYDTWYDTSLHCTQTIKDWRVNWCMGRAQAMGPEDTDAVIAAHKLGGLEAVHGMRRPSKPPVPTKPARDHALVRPNSYDYNVMFALTDDGLWIPDDGDPHRAFSGLDGQGFPYAVTAECPTHDSCWGFRGVCPNRIAMDVTCRRFGAANGRRVPAWVGDLAGALGA